MEKGRKIIVPAAAALFLLAALHFTGIGCPIKFLTGISCGGCGMTRAYISLASFDLEKAFYYHPLFLLPPVYCVFYALRKKTGERLFKIVTAVFVGAFLVLYAARLADPRDTVVVFDVKSGFLFKILTNVRGLFNG